ncbi:MAG: hypothetical protein KGZ39_03710 [Simkania sp.]|nr:hypothetical protein [Simkania sp.]
MASTISTQTFGLLSFYPQEKRIALVDQHTVQHYLGIAETTLCALEALSSGQLSAFDAASIQDYQCQARALQTVLIARSLLPIVVEEQRIRIVKTIERVKYFAAEQSGEMDEQKTSSTKKVKRVKHLPATETVGEFFERFDREISMTAEIRRIVGHYFLAHPCDPIDFRYNEDNNGIMRVFTRVDDNLADRKLSKAFAESVRSALAKELSKQTCTDLAGEDETILEETLSLADGRMIPPFFSSVKMFLKQACQANLMLVLGVDFALDSRRVELPFRLKMEGAHMTSEFLWRNAA